jgi:hypothetical protein
MEEFCSLVCEQQARRCQPSPRCRLSPFLLCFLARAPALSERDAKRPGVAMRIPSESSYQGGSIRRSIVV